MPILRWRCAPIKLHPWQESMTLCTPIIQFTHFCSVTKSWQFYCWKIAWYRSITCILLCTVYIRRSQNSKILEIISTRSNIVLLISEALTIITITIPCRSPDASLLTMWAYMSSDFLGVNRQKFWSPFSDQSNQVNEWMTAICSTAVKLS